LRIKFSPPNIDIYDIVACFLVFFLFLCPLIGSQFCNETVNKGHPNIKKSQTKRTPYNNNAHSTKEKKRKKEIFEKLTHMPSNDAKGS